MDGEQNLGITLTETTEEYHSCPEDAVDTCTSVTADIQSIQKDVKVIRINKTDSVLMWYREALKSER